MTSGQWLLREKEVEVRGAHSSKSSTSGAASAGMAQAKIELCVGQPPIFLQLRRPE